MGNPRSSSPRAWLVVALAFLTLDCGPGPQGPSLASPTPTVESTATPAATPTPTPTPTPKPRKSPSPSPRPSIFAFIFGDVSSGQIFLQTKVHITCTSATLTYQGPVSPSTPATTTPSSKPVVVHATTITSQPQDSSGKFQWTFLFKWASPPAAGKWLFNATCVNPDVDVKASQAFVVQ